MINLLPPETKQEYLYAKRNVHLIHWISAGFAALAGVVLISAAGLFIMDKSIDSYKTLIASDQYKLASQDLAGTKAQVTDISNNLKLMDQVLSKEILFSDLLTRLGSLTPPNTILTNLSISQAQSAIDITAETGNYNAATQLQINLADPSNQIFSKADIVNITCNTGAQVTNPKYPCTATIRAEFTSDNPFLFINSKGTTK